jgi:hypothetical protein
VSGSLFRQAGLGLLSTVGQDKTLRMIPQAGWTQAAVSIDPRPVCAERSLQAIKWGLKRALRRMRPVMSRRFVGTGVGKGLRWFMKHRRYIKNITDDTHRIRDDIGPAATGWLGRDKNYFMSNQAIKSIIRFCPELFRLRKLTPKL